MKDFELSPERCRPWIEAALKYTGGTHLFEDVVANLAKGTMYMARAKGVHSFRNCGIS